MLFQQANAKYFAAIWLLLVLLCSALLIARLPTLEFETDVLALLPIDKAQQENPLIEKALAAKSQYAARMFFLLGSDSEHAAVNAAEQLRSQLNVKVSGMDLFNKLELRIDAGAYVGAYKPLLNYRFQLLGSDDREALKKSGDAFIRHTLNTVYTPLGLARLAVLETDPVYTFSTYLQSLNTQKLELHNDVPVFRYNNKFYALMNAELSSDVDTFAANAALLSAYKNANAWALANDVELLSAGLPLYNAFAQQQAESEISSIGLFSIAMIVLLMWLCFRSLTPLLLSLWVIASGILLAFTASMYLFPKLHLITLVFGSSLIGVAIDYAFHYLSSFFQQRGNGHSHASEHLKSVFKGISLGMLSSVLAYGVLAFSPFPGLQQIAAFSALGLFGAWLTVVLLLPWMLSHFTINHALPLSPFYPWYITTWPRWLQKNRKPMLLLLSVYLASSTLFFEAVDDIRILEKPNDELYAQEQKMKAITQQQQAGQFFLVSAKTTAELLHNEKALLAELKPLMGSAFSGYQALSELYPNAQQQQKDYDLLKKSIVERGQLQAMLNELGLESNYIDKINQALGQDDIDILGFESWLQAMSEPLQQLFLGCELMCASIISISGIHQLTPLQDLGEARRDFGVIWVDPVANVNAVLAEYRGLSVYFIVISLAVVLLILTVFLNFTAALRILMTPVLAMLICVATLSFLPLNFSLFNVFALLLVLGISLDYAIFQYLAEGHRQTTALAILLSLITTLMAFGLLALSSTMLIQAFGITLAIGIAVAFLIAPLSSQKKEK